jgi:hypothetical protein
VSGWLSPVLIALSTLLLARSFYLIYVRGIRSPATTAITWVSFSFVLCFWTWHLGVFDWLYDGVASMLFPA